MADAYTAARMVKTSGAADFKLCTDPQQPLVDGRALVSTFTGKDCESGWVGILRMDLPEVQFIPAFFVDPRLLLGSVPLTARLASVSTSFNCANLILIILT